MGTPERCSWMRLSHPEDELRVQAWRMAKLPFVVNVKHQVENDVIPAGCQATSFCQQGLDIRKLMESGCKPNRSRFLAEAPIPPVLENTKRHPASTANCNRALNRAVCTPLRRCTNRQLVVRR